jgi:hypothetical protein
MKISEARKIVGKMVLWSMITQGIEPEEKPEPLTEDLQTLLKANRVVEKANDRSRKRVQNILSEKGQWKGRRSISMTIADRGIAALYVAANFKGDHPTNADILAKHNDNLVFCLSQSKIE